MKEIKLMKNEAEEFNLSTYFSIENLAVIVIALEEENHTKR